MPTICQHTHVAHLLNFGLSACRWNLVLHGLKLFDQVPVVLIACWLGACHEAFAATARHPNVAFFRQYEQRRADLGDEPGVCDQRWPCNDTDEQERPQTRPQLRVWSDYGGTRNHRNRRFGADRGPETAPPTGLPERRETNCSLRIPVGRQTNCTLRFAR